MASYLKTLDNQHHWLVEKRPSINCFRCGLCCIRYQPRLTEDEIAELARRLSLSPGDFLSSYIQVTTVGYLLRQVENRCIFLFIEEEGNRASCTIYPFRPEACRNWTPGPTRRECREGLARLKTKGHILLVSEVYPSDEEREQFYASLR